MINALLVVSEITPARAGQCSDLIRHLNTGDKTVFKPRAQALIYETLESYRDIITQQQIDVLSAALTDYQPPNADNPLTIEYIRFASGLSLKQLSERFSIPYRTLQGWTHGTRNAPQYVLQMMKELLERERSE